MNKKLACLLMLLPTASSAFTMQSCSNGSALQFNPTNGFSCGSPTSVMGNTSVSDVNYTALPTDQVITYTSLTAPRTVTLTPIGSPANLKMWQVKDVSGSASISIPINLASTSGTFDGLSSTAISEANGSKTFYDDGINFFMGSAFLPSANASFSIQKADGNGGLLNAVSGTDYMSPSAVSSTYVPQTTTVNGHALSSNVTVAYSDLTGLPTIPAAQVNSDWNASSGIAQILNKPTLSTVATSGSYSDLSNKPSIPSAQIQSDWNEANTGLADYIKNKPTIPSVVRTSSTSTLSLVGAGATGTQISSTNDSTVRYEVSTSTTSTIGGPSTSIVILKTCATNSSTEGDWTEIGRVENDQTITLAIALQSIQLVKGQITADVPAGFYVKLENSGTGTHTETFVTGQKTIYG